MASTSNTNPTSAAGAGGAIPIEQYNKQGRSETDVANNFPDGHNANIQLTSPPSQKSVWLENVGILLMHTGVVLGAAVGGAILLLTAPLWISGMLLGGVIGKLYELLANDNSTQVKPFKGAVEVGGFIGSCIGSLGVFALIHFYGKDVEEFVNSHPYQNS